LKIFMVRESKFKKPYTQNHQFRRTNIFPKVGELYLTTTHIKWLSPLDKIILSTNCSFYNFRVPWYTILLLFDTIPFDTEQEQLTQLNLTLSWQHLNESLLLCWQSDYRWIRYLKGIWNKKLLLTHHNDRVKHGSTVSQTIPLKQPNNTGELKPKHKNHKIWEDQQRPNQNIVEQRWANTEFKKRDCEYQYKRIKKRKISHSLIAKILI